MSPAYIKGVKENFGNAVIVFDKFHVVSQVSAAVEESAARRFGKMPWRERAFGKDLLAVAQEPGGLDGEGEPALGAIEGQTTGDRMAYSMRLQLQQAYASGSATVARADS